MSSHFNVDMHPRFWRDRKVRRSVWRSGGGAPPPPSSLLTGLVGYWPMDEVNGTRFDSSGNGNHLSAVNNPGMVAGKLGNAANFVAASSQYLNAVLDPVTQTKVCFSVWMNRPTGTTNVYVGWGTVGNRHCGMMLYADAKAYMLVETVNSAGYGYTDGLTGWHHYVGCYDGSAAAGSRVVMYRDGVLLTPASIAEVSPNWSSGGSLFLAGYNAIGTSFSNGYVDEMALYIGVTLTAAQAVSLFGGGTPPPYPFIGIP